MLRTSSITQVSQTSRAMTPDPAASRAVSRSSSSRGLISFMAHTSDRPMMPVAHPSG